MSAGVILVIFEVFSLRVVIRNSRFRNKNEAEGILSTMLDDKIKYSCVDTA